MSAVCGLRRASGVARRPDDNAARSDIGPTVARCRLVVAVTFARVRRLAEAAPRLGLPLRDEKAEVEVDPVGDNDPPDELLGDVRGNVRSAVHRQDRRG